MGTAASILWAARVNATQRQDREDLDLLLDASSAGWAEVTDQFFAVPESTAQTIAALTPRVQSRDELLTLLAESIRAVPAVDAAFVGYADGSFVFVGRPDIDNDPVVAGIRGLRGPGFRTRIVSVSGADRTVDLTWTDADLNVVRADIDPADDYDPRVRPWYVPIAAGAERAWTEPYLFASSQDPGVTHSVRVLDSGGALFAVVGVDIRLTELSAFLDALRPGPRGEALVIDGQGRVIAAAPPGVADEVLAHNGGLESLDQTSELLALVAALDRDEADHAITRSADRTYTTIVRPAGRGNDWYLAIRANDADFLGDVSTESTSDLVGIGATGIAVATLVGLLGLAALGSLDRLRARATLDELTGLLNRRAAKEALNAMIAEHRRVSVAIVDLDRFKAINDRFGHLTGDAVLATLSTRIERFADEIDARAGRLGGDEFIILVEGERIWEPLIDRLCDPVLVDGGRFRVGASIGVVVADPCRNRTSEALLRAADHSLFRIKRSGGGSVGITGFR